MDNNLAFLQLHCSGRSLQFERIGLVFLAHDLRDVFATKNNKTVRETLEQRRYRSLAPHIQSEYGRFLDLPLGDFLAILKSKGALDYKLFLNAYGDLTYCQFRLSDSALARGKGLYLYRVGPEIVYIGRSYDPFAKRVNQGYGKIHPKNCYRDGQSTNCHLNSLIAAQHGDVSFYVCLLDDKDEIERLERVLIQERRPRWNVALAR